MLAAHDWSASQDKFALGVAVLKEEWAQGFNLMRRLRHDQDFDRANYKEWPLFRQLRKHEEFPAVYQECYGEVFESQEAISSAESDEENGEPDAEPNSRPSPQLPASSDIQSPDSQRTASSGGCG
jgi:hypothetical protein